MPRTTFWTTVSARATRAMAMAAVAAFLAASACGSNPTAPTPTPEPPPTPVPDPPAISCPAPMSVSTTSSSGASVTFSAPTVTNGEAPITVACTPTSGSTFPIGTTSVQCTATDARSRTASCTFSVTVSLVPQLSKTRFMAFGDSITAGEVTVPTTGVFPTGAHLAGSQVPSFRQVVVPSASYPTQLQSLLLGRYTSQPGIVVVNEGKPGENAADAVPRFTVAMSTHRPEVVLLLEGYNGLTQEGGASSSAAAIATMAAEARNRGARVFIATLTPGKPGFRQIPDAYIQNYNDRMRAIARGEGALLVDLYAALLPDVNTWIGVDGLHPTEAGYRKMAETFFASIQSDLEIR